MAIIYNASLTASGNSGDLTVTVGDAHGLTATGKVRVEAKLAASDYKIIGFADEKAPTKIVFPPTSTIRLVDESGASNAVKLED